MKKFWILLPMLFALFWMALPAAAQTDPAETGMPAEFQWPRAIETAEAKIILYQPQLEAFEGNHLRSRFAASVQSPRMEAPEFGAVWVESRLEVNRDDRTARMVAVEDVQSRFPNATAESEQWFADVLKKEIPTWDIVLSLDQIVAELEAAKEQLKTEQALNDTPPDIIYSEKPAVLVLVDGDPILKPIENTDLMAVINTPYPMVFRKADKTYYLIGKETWYKSKKIAAQWQETADPPSDIAALEREAADDDDVESAVAADAAVFGATEPTEMLSIDGEPRFVPFAGNNIMYVENTDNDLLYEVDTGKYYLLLSGRWYSTKQLKGSWTYVPPEKVPATFADIAPDSKKGDLRASVPGTDEAREAVMDAQLPETAAIKRSEAELTVAYDGEPEFKKIQGTGIDYAVNTATPVIRTQGRYYAVDNGVWFTAAAAKGPWGVADAVPAEVQNIPPSSPVNNIKYVYIYDSTPEVVYVGYTPGYLGCYIHHGVVVYGTGYYYRPWYRHYYYPRPLTYGFSVSYSSYYGWSFGVSFFHGPFSFHFGHAWGYPCYGGWWGPPRYRPPYYRPPHYRPPAPRPPGHHPSKPRPSVARPPIAKPPGGGKPSLLPAAQGPSNRPGSGNLYDQRPDRMDKARPGTRDIQNRKTTGKPAALPNNVYTDRQGNVYRKDQNGWKQYQDRQWQQPTQGSQGKPAQQPAQRPSGSVQKPAQQPTQRPSDSVQKPTQQPAQRPSGSVQKPAQQPAQRPGGSVQQPTQQPSQRPSGSTQQKPSTRQSRDTQQRPAATPGPAARQLQPFWDRQQRSLDQQQQSRDRGNQRTRQFQRSQQSDFDQGGNRQIPSKDRSGGWGR